MAKKSYKTQASFVFFNAYQIEDFDTTFEKIRLAAFNTLHHQRLPYKQWSTILNKKTSLKNAWDYDSNQQGVDYYFRRWWLDQVVNEFGLMIWNAVNKMHFDTWYQTSFLPETDLPRKLQANPEAVSSHLADQVTNDFLSHFH